MYLSEDKTYANLEKLANLMDDKFELFGFKFGLNFFIDLIPWVGDILTSAIALYIFFASIKYKISKLTIVRMAVNIMIYFVVGLIPWLGDIFGAWWKPNRRNLKLLQKKLNADNI